MKSYLFKRANGIYYLKYMRKGKWTYKSLQIANEREARREQRAFDREMETILAEEAAEEPPPASDAPSELTWAELRVRYLEWAGLHCAPATVAKRELAMRMFVEHSGAVRVRDVTAEAVEAYKRHRRAGCGKPRTVNESLQSLKAVMNRARRQGWYEGENPFDRTDYLPEPKKRPLWLERHELLAILEAAAQYSPDALRVFALGLYAGLRKGEIVQARWEWVDWAAGLLHVRRSETWEVKDREDRTIPLHDRLRDLLGRDRQEHGWIVAPAATQGKHRYRFDFKRSFAVVVQKAQERLKKAALEAGRPLDAGYSLAWVTPHSLRHTFASQLVSAGVDLYKVSVWLGHENVRTTQIYAHLRPHDQDINKF